MGYQVYWPKHQDIDKVLKVECTPILGEVEYPPIFAISSRVLRGKFSYWSWNLAQKKENNFLFLFSIFHAWLSNFSNLRPFVSFFCEVISCFIQNISFLLRNMVQFGECNLYYGIIWSEFSFLQRKWNPKGCEPWSSRGASGGKYY